MAVVACVIALIRQSSSCGIAQAGERDTPGRRRVCVEEQVAQLRKRGNGGGMERKEETSSACLRGVGHSGRGIAQLRRSGPCFHVLHVVSEERQASHLVLCSSISQNAGQERPCQRTHVQRHNTRGSTTHKSTGTHQLPGIR